MHLMNWCCGHAEVELAVVVVGADEDDEVTPLPDALDGDVA